MGARLKYLPSQQLHVDAGIYTLVLRLDEAKDIEVGALGTIHFEKGYFAYTGSARGPGGLKRVDRHKEVMSGVNVCRKWHIDYLLPHTSLVDVVVTHTSADLECQIAAKIGSQLPAVPKFGSTDCRCLSHLHYSNNLDSILDVVFRAHS
jgi:Uri superfamily endonuclease